MRYGNPDATYGSDWSEKGWAIGKCGDVGGVAVYEGSLVAGRS